MTWYVGLTDDPERRRGEHGKRSDWHVREPFASEPIGRAWEEELLKRTDCRGGPGGSGWRYGYWYTIMPDTRQ